MEGYSVNKIEYNDTKPFILDIHYAHRMPSISFSFGLFYKEELVGVITYGKPASSALQKGIAGEKNSRLVYELNRLVLKNNKKNEASFLISQSFKLLPKPLILVSYADTEQGHIGTVYKATNWINTGLSAKRTDWKIKGLEHLHGQTIADKSRGVKNRAKYMRDLYGDNFYLKERSRKHRFIMILGNKKEKKVLLKQLKYSPVEIIR